MNTREPGAIRFTTRYLPYLLLGLLHLTPASSLASEHGRRLYADNCAVCHGSTGTGGVGVPLALPEFIDTVDDNYLRNTIIHGRPGRIMPSFSNLKPGEINAVIEYMRSWTGKTPTPFSKKRISGNVENGRQIYHQRCAACHGINGEGGHGTGVTFSRPRDLPILAPALNNRGFLAAASDSMIRNTLIHGRKGTPMISFRDLGLSDNDINDVVAFVRSFETAGKKEVIGDAALEPPYLVRESPNSLDTTVQNVKDAVLNANMRLIRVQHLDQGLVAPEKENRKQVIVYSCGFNFLNEALKVDPRVGLFLPCRVTVVEHRGKVLVMTVNPKRLSAVFNNNELEQLCDQMHQTYLDILDEATL